jgi:hypothetical protein
MKKLKIFSDNGFIALAVGVMIVALFSVIAISYIGVYDTNDMVVSYQIAQQLHLLRSETTRGIRVAEDQINSGTGGLTGISSLSLGGEEYRIESGFGKFTFKVNSKIYQEANDEASPFVDSNIINISTFTRCYTGFGAGAKDSPITFYSKKVIKNNTFAGFHYFTDNEDSINEDLGDEAKVKFWGPDVIHGIVRSNTDIYIQQAGGGTNNGWPTFHDHVYTSGEIKPYGGSGSIPYDEVFLDGYDENLPKVEFPENASEAQAGRHLPVDPEDFLLAYVDGASYDLWSGDRQILYPDTVVVYDAGIEDDTLTVPREDSLGVQYITVIDTFITPRGTGRVNNSSIYIEGELWITGTFSGRQTWASQDTMYLVGDILLTNTAKGAHPDGYNPITDSFTGPVNQTDYVGLISERSILIQYGYRTPDDSIRVKYNCGRYEDIDGDEGEGGISIYAAMAALGRGETSMEDGVFSFQYQHPHSGLIARVNGQLVELPDFQLYNIPPYNNGWGPLHFLFKNNDWPANYAYPYYGPLWPEKKTETFMERGYINLYGSVAQRRRGYVHRSGSDPYNTGGGWDIANYRYGAHPNSLGNPNAPSATGGGVGYKKNYNYDYRLKTSPPPNFPAVHLEGGTSAFDPESWYLYRGENAPYDLIF